VRWGRRLGVLEGTSAPAIDGEELAAAHDLRRAVYTTFAALARGGAPPPDALAALARTHAVAAGAARLVGGTRAPAAGAARLVGGTRAPAAGAAPLVGGPRAWRLDWPARDPRRVRFAVAVDALALLGDEPRLARLRRCPGRNCGWLFLDASGRRRWCSMTTCGSREKMRRMYERRHAAS
jgi:predicted RNA-binding Zn ribbon-like protein